LHNPRNSLIAFACDAGTKASDGKVGENGLFTKHLLIYIKKANVPIQDVLIKVNRKVQKESGGTQVPWQSSSLTKHKICLCTSEPPPQHGQSSKQSPPAVQKLKQPPRPVQNSKNAKPVPDTLLAQPVRLP
jgi:uncharacterized caspase-like protein